VVKEPIHNYVSISSLEAELINDPLFQRLHNISQNGTAYLTYPSNRTSRFVHSLGAMHLGGLMLCSALFNSELDDRLLFLEALDKLISEVEGELKIHHHQITDFLRSEDDICYRSFGFDPRAPEQANRVVLFQSIRIACVLHDVGHPPFSHTTEAVMKSKVEAFVPSEHPSEYAAFVSVFSRLQNGEGGALHEKIGTALIGFVFAEFKGKPAVFNFGQLCFRVASRIADFEPYGVGPRGILKSLHRIVSCHGFDADRADYVLRDGYASSFDFGEYDLARIIDNLRVVGNKSGEIELVATTTAVSALESFFLERYRIWRWLVFHHSVTRGHLALSRALAILFELFFDPAPSAASEKEIKGILDEYSFSLLWKSFESPAEYRQYVRCDEHWLLAMLRKIQMLPVLRDKVPRRLRMLKIYLDYLLDRNKVNLKTLWKRAEEYEEFAAEVEKTFKAAFAKLSPARKLRLKKLKRAKKESATQWFNRVVIPFLSKDLKNGEIETTRVIEDGIQNALKTRGVNEGSLLLSVLQFKIDIDSPIVDKNENRMRLQELSSLVQDLPQTWNKDIQLRAYWVGLKKKSGLFLSDEKTCAPTTVQLGDCFLEAVLGGTNWVGLSKLLPTG
jgi:HD superfamily phosphohydrolase